VLQEIFSQATIVIKLQLTFKVVELKLRLAQSVICSIAQVQALLLHKSIQED
jgi:hypothetical protein